MASEALTAEQHTPGPWTAKAETVRENFKPVCNRFAICACDDEGPVGHIDFSDANARLIAAAPDLLETLKKAADTFDDLATALGIFGKSTAAEACRIARDASRVVIAKAEGRS